MKEETEKKQEEKEREVVEEQSRKKEEEQEQTEVLPDNEGDRGREVAAEPGYEELQELLEKERSEKELYKERSLRFQADFVNYKKRVLKERERTIKQANRDLLEGFLPVIDNLERAISSRPEDDDLAVGVKMILDQMLQYLYGKGLEQIDPLGQIFDPSYHEAVERVEQDGCEEDTIIQVLQKGYSFQDEVLRAAVVKVAG